MRLFQSQDKIMFKNIKMWHLLPIISIIFFSIFIFSGCASLSRGMKTVGSDISGGLERTVKVYDYNGNELAEYEGKIDLREEESKVFFDLDGKRVVIYNAIVITEEKGLE